MNPADFLSMQSLWELVSKGDSFKLGNIIPFVKENIGTFMSVSVSFIKGGN